MFARVKTDDKENIYTSSAESSSKAETVRLDSDSSLDTMSLLTDSSDPADSSATLRHGKRRQLDFGTLLQPVKRSETSNKRCRSPSINHGARHVKSTGINHQQHTDNLEFSEMSPPSPVFSRHVYAPALCSNGSDDKSDVTVLSLDSLNDSECISILDCTNSPRVANSPQKNNLCKDDVKPNAKEISVNDVCFLDKPKLPTVCCRKNTPDVICLSDSDDESCPKASSRRHGHVRHPHLKARRRGTESCSTSGKELSRSPHKVDVEVLSHIKSRSKLDLKPKKDEKDIREREYGFSASHILGELRKSPRCQLFPKKSPTNLAKSSSFSKMLKASDSSKHAVPKSSKSRYALNIPFDPLLPSDKHSKALLPGEVLTNSKTLCVHKRKAARDKGNEASGSVAPVPSHFIPLPLEPTTDEHDGELQVEQPQQQVSDHSSGAERTFLHQLRLSPAVSTSEHDDRNKCMLPNNSIRPFMLGAARFSPHRQSPDPVEIVEQVHTDEILAQALQAEFDLEINPVRDLMESPVVFTQLRRRPHIDRRRDEVVVLPHAYLDIMPPRLSPRLEGRHLNHGDVPMDDLFPHTHRPLMHSAFTNASAFMPGSISSTTVSTSSASANALPAHLRRRHRHQLARHAHGFRRMWETTFNAENDYEMLWELANHLGEVNTNTMTERQINQLPTRHYRGSKGDAARANTCHICLNEYEQGERLRILPCTHEFHLSCIDRWIKDHPTCPICRSDCRT